MNANYRHVLVFAEAAKAEQACKWIKDHVDLSNQHTLADCAVDQSTSFPEVVFYTEGMLSNDLIRTILLACQPGINGGLLPGHAVFNIDERNVIIVPENKQEDSEGYVIEFQAKEGKMRQPGFFPLFHDAFKAAEQYAQDHAGITPFTDAHFVVLLDGQEVHRTERIPPRAAWTTEE